ncbi:helix-turn-helix domain-containing protein [Massilibacteroides vaginae]|uniref:helix-turn-helix domain-containing protein n=1 Tax=Massilibacteroides vaginae TaxID=1673718 RepID=UPI001FE6F78D|nr:AraC family transcriptional regulator [Massilibacteroides vaginae]
MVVNKELEKLGFSPTSVKLGVVEFADELDFISLEKIDLALQKLGFALVIDKKSQTTQQIKAIIIDLIYNKNCILKTNLSDYLQEKLHFEYNYLSNIFSEVETTTIEKYFIAQKIEKVKELLEYGELTLSEIADQLNYSSVAHLSSQFKKITNISPSQFKEIQPNSRKALDEI